MQQFALRLNGHIAYLVKEEHPAMCHLKQAFFLCHCIGKRALFMAKEFALNQRIGNGPAVNCNERLFRSGTVFMKGARDKALPCPGLAGNQHLRDTAVDDAGHVFEEVLHLLAFTDDVLKADVRWCLIAIGIACGDERAAGFQGALHLALEDIDLDWFLKVIKRAFVRDEVHGIVKLRERRHDKHRQVRVLPFYRPEQFAAFKTRGHPHVADNQIKHFFFHSGEGSVAVAHGLDGVAFTL